MLGKQASFVFSLSFRICFAPSCNLLDSITRSGSTISFNGTGISSNDSSWGAALAAAASADVVILALGTDHNFAREGRDLNNISLPLIQQQFGQAVLAAAGSKPVLLLIVSSFPIAFDSLADSVTATVLAYNPAFGAPAVAAALFGVNRWGRAVMTVYPGAYQEAVALDDFSMVPGPNNPGRCARACVFVVALSPSVISLPLSPRLRAARTATTTAQWALRWCRLARA